MVLRRHRVRHGDCLLASLLAFFFAVYLSAAV